MVNWKFTFPHRVAAERVPTLNNCLPQDARQKGIKLPKDTAIDAEVDLLRNREGAFLQARLNISLPGLEKAAAQQVVELASQTCPYSKAIRGNINVDYKVV